jgi:hypothetical protein
MKEKIVLQMLKTVYLGSFLALFYFKNNIISGILSSYPHGTDPILVKLARPIKSAIADDDEPSVRMSMR